MNCSNRFALFGPRSESERIGEPEQDELLRREGDRARDICESGVGGKKGTLSKSIRSLSCLGTFYCTSP